MEMNARLEMQKRMKGEFYCPCCEGTNMRVKETEFDDFTLNAICSCNECDCEWTEHFNLSYAGYTHEDKYHTPDGEELDV